MKGDRFRNRTVLSVRVRSIFDSVGVKLTQNEDQLLREAFQDVQSGDMFDSGKSCAVIAPPEEKPTPERELLLLLISLREPIEARRRKIREAFPGSLGETTTGQVFRNALATFGRSIREAEIQRLLKSYWLNRQKDVDWQRFAADMENARIPN